MSFLASFRVLLSCAAELAEPAAAELRNARLRATPTAKERPAAGAMARDLAPADAATRLWVIVMRDGPTVLLCRHSEARSLWRLPRAPIYIDRSYLESAIQATSAQAGLRLEWTAIEYTTLATDPNALDVVVTGTASGRIDASRSACHVYQWHSRIPWDDLEPDSAKILRRRNFDAMQENPS